MLTFATLKSRARASMVGCIARHGGHHGAQKSTSTGSADSSTSRFQLKSCSNMAHLAIYILHRGNDSYSTRVLRPPLFHQPGGVARLAEAAHAGNAPNRGSKPSPGM